MLTIRFILCAALLGFASMAWGANPGRIPTNPATRGASTLAGRGASTIPGRGASTIDTSRKPGLGSSVLNALAGLNPMAGKTATTKTSSVPVTPHPFMNRMTGSTRSEPIFSNKMHDPIR